MDADDDVAAAAQQQQAAEAPAEKRRRTGLNQAASTGKAQQEAPAVAAEAPNGTSEGHDFISRVLKDMPEYAELKREVELLEAEIRKELCEILTEQGFGSEKRRRGKKEEDEERKKKQELYHLIMQVIEDKDHQAKSGATGAPGFSYENASVAKVLSVAEAIEHAYTILSHEDVPKLRASFREAKPNQLETIKQNYAQWLRRIQFPGAEDAEVHAIGIGDDAFAATHRPDGEHKRLPTDYADLFRLLFIDVERDQRKQKRREFAEWVKGVLSGNPGELPGGLDPVVCRAFCTIQIVELARERVASKTQVDLENSLIVKALEDLKEMEWYLVYGRTRGSAIFARTGGFEKLRRRYAAIQTQEYKAKSGGQSEPEFLNAQEKPR